jgi:carboxyl-terminal processing protease
MMQRHSPARHFRYAFLTLLLAGSGIFFSASGTAGRSGNSFSVAPISESDSEKQLSPKDRIEVFEIVWKDIRDTYYDPEFHGVNWQEVHDRYQPLVDPMKSDKDFYALLNRMAGELHDAHTRFNSPEAWENRQKFQGVTTGIQLQEMDGKVVVIYVYPDSSAAHAGVEPGMILASVDGRPVADLLAEAAAKVPISSTERITRVRVVGSILAGAVNSSAKLNLLRADGSTFEVSVARQALSLPPDAESHLLPSGEAYIRFDGFQPPVEKEFKDALTVMHAAPGLIIDLRRNGGGRGDVMANLAGDFLTEKTVIPEYMQRKDISESEKSGNEKEHRKVNAGKDGGQLFAGPVVILTNERSASSSELFAGGLQEVGRAKVVGGQTCGCVIGIANQRKVKGGGVLEVSQVLFFTPKGRKLEGEGVIPDLAVAPTIADFQQHRDPVLEAGKKLLREMGANAN